MFNFACYKICTMKHKYLFAAIVLCLCRFTLFAESDTLRVVSASAEVESSQVSEQRVDVAPMPVGEDRTDSLVSVRIRTVNLHRDTLTTIISTADSTAREVEDIIPADSADRRGHYLDAYIGLGGGSLGYKLKNSDSHTGTLDGGFSALLQLQYAYYFHPNWGVTAGLWFTNYTSHATLKGDFYWNDQVDSDTEQHYNHHAHINSWRERETVHSLAIPIGVQWNKYFNDEIGMYAGLGIAPEFAVHNRYKLTSAELVHKGEYPAWGLTLEDMHEFATKQYSNDPQAKGKLTKVKPAVGIFAEVGGQVFVTKQIDFVFGAYFNCTFNDANSHKDNAFGVKDDDFSFMTEPYTGLWSTDMAGKSHPWEVGVKAGIHWHYIAPPRHEFHTEYDPFTRRDTTVSIVERYDTLYSNRIDTIQGIDYSAMYRKVPVSLEPFNLIFFDLDKANINEEAEEYLQAIYGLLQDKPNQRIAVSGHASTEGNYQHNVRLARRRAENVVKRLIELGIEPERIETRSYGPDVPYDNDANHDLSLDRRVEITPIDD